MDPAERLRSLESALCQRGSDLALYLVFERPTRVAERPALARTFFAERCVSDAQLDQMVDAVRSIGGYVELFDGEHPFLKALTEGRLERLGRPLQVVYNGIGWGITAGGFQPGRKALIPAIADSYGLICANSDAYTCAFALHRFHSFVVLRALGIAAPPVWHFRPGVGWMGEAPPIGTKVIVKSTYEAWSVGVTDDSVFTVDDSCEARASAIADEIGQPVTAQQFVSGREVCVTVLACPEPITPPPVEQILAKAPGDRDAVMTMRDNLTHGGYSYLPFSGPAGVLSQMRSTALEVFGDLQLQAFGRMDFRIDEDDRPWLTDVAISPGLSQSSSAFASLGAWGFDHPAFLRAVIAATLGTRGVL